MKALIYLEVAADAMSISYETDLLYWIKMTFPDVVVMNLDNHSDSIMVQYCLSLIKKANQLLIFVDNSGQQEVSLDNTLKILRHVVHSAFSQEELKIVLLGKHTAVEKIGKALSKVQFIQTSLNVEAKREISLYFSKG